MNFLLDLQYKCRLVIFVKEPHPGSVKTRLARDIGKIESAQWYRHESRSTIQRLSRDARWDTLLAVTPDIEGLSSRIWQRTVPRIAQGPGDLGKRFRRIFTSLPVGPTIIIGSDIPGILSMHVQNAFRLLSCNQAVFGPSQDGGYWLVGLRGPTRHLYNLFRNVRWSTRYALQDSLISLTLETIELINNLNDIDTIDDMRDHESSKKSFTLGRSLISHAY